MSTSLQKIVQAEAYKVVFWQLTLLAFIAVITLLYKGPLFGLSVFLGGLAYAVPTLIFVWCALRFAGAQQMNMFMVVFFFGEAVKLALSGIFFLLIVNYLSVSLLSVLVGFISSIIAFWLVSVWRFSKPAINRNV